MERNGIEFWVGFSSAEGYRTELLTFASIFVLRNGIPSYFLFCGRIRNEIPRFLFRGTTGIPSEINICSSLIRNGIPKICIYFGSTKRNSELGSLPQKGAENNYWRLLLFLFCGRVRNGIPRFSVPRNNRNFVGNKHLFGLFPGCKIPPTLTLLGPFRNWE